ncbi:protein kinase [Nocardia vinacea]|uniref:protein kinase domain-containing protein n=1 Tax=Nocardia vinacea TaxID=96468 RepID=UPI002E0F1865|nr:protein kinase [Nocardia vinacea]
MELHPLHPARWVLDQLRRHGWHIQDLLAFTRSSTLALAHRDGEESVVVKAGFGSNHVLAAMPEGDRPAAYGFYWYQQMSPAERTMARSDFRHERDLVRECTGVAHVVPLLAEGHCEDFDWYTMPHYPDGNFATLMATTGTEPSALAGQLSILADIAEGLAELHRRGVVHRDVYQENILIDHGRGLITDLGAARRLHAPHGPRHRGPEVHWPPEYLTEYERAGPPADVFSLAVLTHRVLLGDIPRLAIPPSFASIPNPLSTALRSSLAHTPADRPSMTEFRNALQRAAIRATTAKTP